jgi:steroid delta-isomerase-like uncharacterized protein
MRSIKIGAVTLVGIIGSFLAAACGGEEPTPVTPPPPPPAVSVSSAQTAEPPPTPPEPPKPTLGELEAASGKAMLDALNAHDADKLAALYTNDGVYIHEGHAPAVGQDAIKAGVAGLFAAFPDAKFASARTFVKNDVVVAEFGWTGTNSGELMGQKPTGKQVGLMGLGIYWYTPEGKIKESHQYMDDGSLAMQLGMPKAKGRPMVGLPTNSELHVAKGTPAEDANVSGAKTMLGLFEAKDAKAFVDGMTDDGTYEMNLSPKPMAGKKDAKIFFSSITKAFPDLKYTAANVWGVEDFAIDEYVMTGTQKGAFTSPGGTIPATGKAVTIHGAEILQMKDGKLVKGWGYENGVEFAMQLGLMKAPGQGGAKAPAASAKAPAKK